MLGSITVEDMEEFLSKLGIEVYKTDDDEDFRIIDMDNTEFMEATYSRYQYPMIFTSGTLPLTMDRELVLPGKSVTMKSNHKYLDYYLNLATKPNGERFSSLYHFLYQNIRPDNVVEKYYASFEKSPQTNGKIKINTSISKYGELSCDEITNKDITITGDGEIHFEINGRDGFLVNGKAEDGWYLDESEMREELKSNQMITILTELYGKQYPKVLETLNVAKESTLAKN